MTTAASMGAGSPHRARPRRPWLAALLAILCAGLGHLYAGRPLRALAFSYGAGSLAVLGVVIAVWLDMDLLAVLGVIVVCTGAVYLWQIIDAVRVARQAGPAYALRRYNHPLVYVGFFALALVAPGSRLLRAHVLESFRTPSGSMAPTLLTGDLIFVTKIGARARALQRGVLLVYRDTDRPSDTFVKRVIGLPGETIEVRDGLVFVDGKPLEQRPAGEAAWEDSSRPGAPPLVVALFEEAAQNQRYTVARTRDVEAAAPDAPATQVPEGHYFVLGDNRDNSADSRTRGPVPRENVVGVAQCVWFSTSSTGLRTDRIGLRL